MKSRLALAAFAVAALAACGKQGDVDVRFVGHTPGNSKIKDDRSVEFKCPVCGAAVNADAKKCTVKACAAQIAWAQDKMCGYCNGAGRCQTCMLYGQEGGKCYNCRGKGYLTILGKTPPCPNCGKPEAKGDGKCPPCKGSGKCDFCSGNGKVSLGDLKTKVKSAAAAE